MRCDVVIVSLLATLLLIYSQLVLVNDLQALGLSTVLT